MRCYLSTVNAILLRCNLCTVNAILLRCNVCTVNAFLLRCNLCTVNYSLLRCNFCTLNFILLRCSLYNVNYMYYTYNPTLTLFFFSSLIFLSYLRLPGCICYSYTKQEVVLPLQSTISVFSSLLERWVRFMKKNV